MNTTFKNYKAGDGQGRAWVLIVVVSTMLSAAPTGSAFGDTINVNARSGQSVVITTHASWNKACEAQKTTITVNSKPANGQILQSGGTVTVRDARVGEVGPCVGKKVAGKTISYRSSMGFKGTDKFRYRVKTPNGTFVNTVTVQVN